SPGQTRPDATTGVHGRSGCRTDARSKSRRRSDDSRRCQEDPLQGLEPVLRGARMTSRTPLTLLASAAVIPLTALALASCGGGGGDATASSPPPKTASGKAATLGVESTSLGKILDDSQGRTLYVFQGDTGTKSNCSGACASN